MRITIELDEKHKTALIKLAADRGERGFSGLINEAVARYLRELEMDERRKRLESFDAAVAAFDANPDFGERLEEHVRELSGRWRTR